VKADLLSVVGLEEGFSLGEVGLREEAEQEGRRVNTDGEEEKKRKR